MQNDIDPEKRTGLLTQAALGGEEIIEGITLRPMTNGTLSLWRELASLNEGYRKEASFSVYSLVFLQSHPISKIRAAFSNPEALVPELFDFMESRPLGDLKHFRAWYDRQIEMVIASTIQADTALGAGESPKA
jgi:hypothetical protein